MKVNARREKLWTNGCGDRYENTVAAAQSPLPCAPCSLSLHLQHCQQQTPQTLVPPAFDYVLAADCIYHEHLVRHLYRVLLHITNERTTSEWGSGWEHVCAPCQLHVDSLDGSRCVRWLLHPAPPRLFFYTACTRPGLPVSMLTHSSSLFPHTCAHSSTLNTQTQLKTVIIANERRSESVQSAFTELFSHSFTFKKVPLSKQDPDFSHPVIELWVLKKKKGASDENLREMEAAEQLQQQQGKEGVAAAAAEQQQQEQPPQNSVQPPSEPPQQQQSPSPSPPPVVSQQQPQPQQEVSCVAAAANGDGVQGLEASIQQLQLEGGGS